VKKGEKKKKEFDRLVQKNVTVLKETLHKVLTVNV